MPRSDSSGRPSAADAPRGLGISWQMLWSRGPVALGRVTQEPWSPGWGESLVSRDLASLCFPRVPFLVDRPGWRDFATSNDVLFVDPGAELRRDAAHRKRTRNDWLWIERDALEEILGPLEQGASSPRKGVFRFEHTLVDGPTHARQRMLFRYVGRAARPDSGVVERAALWIVTDLVARSYARGRDADTPRRETTEIFHRKTVRDAKRYICENLESRLTIREVAQASGISANYFCSVFHRLAGTTIRSYVRGLRLKEALDRLPRYEGDLTALALDLGFASASHLSHLFRAEFGVTPTRMMRILEEPSAEDLTRGP